MKKLIILLLLLPSIVFAQGYGQSTAKDADGNISVDSGDWIGLGSSAARWGFTNAATDYIWAMNAHIGIGIQVPTEELHLYKGSSYGSFTNILIESDATAYGSGITARNDLDGDLVFQSNGSTKTGTFLGVNRIGLGQLYTYQLTGGLAIGTYGNYPLVFGINDTEYMRIHSGGFVGIGTTTPAAKLAINGGLHVGGDSDPGDDNLEVDGKITTATLQMTTGASNGYVATSDASGNMSWAASAAVSVSPNIQENIAKTKLSFDGVNDNVTISNPSDLDYNIYDFSIIIRGFKPYTQYLGNYTIYSHAGATDTVAIIYRSESTTGLSPDLKLRLNDGSNSAGGTLITDAFLFESTEYLPTSYTIVVTFNRDGDVTGYCYGNNLATTGTIDISSVSDAITPNADIIFGEGGYDDYRGEIGEVVVLNRALTPNEVNFYISGGNPSQLEISSTNDAWDYTSDFSTDEDGWIVYGTGIGGIDGNIDAVSDGVDSYDNCLRVYANANSTNHIIRKPGLDKNSYMLSEFKMYVPSALTHLDSIHYSFGGNYYIQPTNNPTNAGSWSNHVSYGKSGNATYYGQFSMYDGTLSTFSGENDPADDVFYLYDFKSRSLGVIGWWNFKEANSTTVYDKSGNENNGTITGAVLVNVPKFLNVESAQHNTLTIADSVNIGSGVWIRKMFCSVTGDSLGTIFYNTVQSKLDTAWSVTK